MKIEMPLFGFEIEGIESFTFGTTGISIAPFANLNIQKIPLFSEQDLRHMEKEAQWCLIYEGSEAKGYKSKVNLLLMAFKIFCEKHYPFIKYRLCSDNSSLCRRLSDGITFNYSYPRSNLAYDSTDLESIKDGFLALIEMDQISTRTHNSLYFLYRAWHNTKWIDSFIFMMCAIESLFSKDKPGGAVSAITTRVSSFLNSKPKCTKNEIEDLYDLRSRMTHGNIQASDDPGENLKELNHLEFIIIECFKEIVKGNFYKKYATKQDRDLLMITLNTST